MLRICDLHKCRIFRRFDVAQINHWIKLLDSNEFNEREEASKQLVGAARGSIPALLRATEQSPEATWRVRNILERIGTNGDEATLRLAIAAIQKLAVNRSRPLKASSSELINRWRRLRHDRAAAKLKSLGAEVVQEQGGFAFGGFGGAFFVPDIEEMVAVDLDVRPDPKVDMKAADMKVEKIDEPVRVFKVPIADDQIAPEIDADVKAEKLEEIIEFELEKDIKPKLDIGAKLADAIKLLKDDRPKVGEPEEDEIIIDDVAIKLFIPPAVAADGFMDWDPVEEVTSGRTVAFDKNWKGSDDDLDVLTRLDRTTTVVLQQIDVSKRMIAQILKMPQLKHITLDHSRFDRNTLIGVKRARPGLTIYATGDSLLGVSGTTRSGRFQVSQVVPNSAAQEAGIQVGDYIASADRIAIRGIDELTLTVASKKVGEELQLTLLRSEKEITVSAKLKSRHPAAMPAFDVAPVVPVPLLDPPSK